MGARNQLWVFVVAVGVGSPVLATDPPPRTPDGVMAVLKRVWSNDGDEAAKAVLTLEADPLALPVLRRALATDSNPRHQGDLERLIAKRVAKRDPLNGERIDRWAKEGRLDLLTELRSLTDGKAADAATELLLRASADLKDLGGALNAPLPQSAAWKRTDPWWDGLGAPKEKVSKVFDTELTFPDTDRRYHQELFADRIDMPCAEVRHSLVVCRSHFSHLTTTKATPHVKGFGRCQWQQAVLFANTSVQVEEFAGCVLVADGDLELAPGADLVGSILVVNGNVREWKDLAGTRAYKSLVWATGDIRMTPHNKPYVSQFIAGGSVANAKDLTKQGWSVQENVKEPPLPVRFLDPAEFGLTLEATKDGMKVSKVVEKTAFAEAGLKAGDVIAKVGEVATCTAPAFRRELRRGVIDGAVLLDVVRGKEKLELLVALPDVPAVAKNDGLKAQPPEKKEK